MSALERACQAAKEITERRTGRPVAGDGQTALADLIGKKQPHIAMWLKRGKVPAEVCVDIEGAVEGAVTRSELRPDVFREPRPQDPDQPVGRQAGAEVANDATAAPDTKRAAASDAPQEPARPAGGARRAA
jgi:DNA-binding transcriptional regulator YdaS (Cro superfamily)